MKTSPTRHPTRFTRYAAIIAAAMLLPLSLHAQNFGTQTGNTNSNTNNSVIVSGQNNRILSSPWAIIGSGSGNIISNGGHYSVIGGGLNNFDAGSTNSKLGFIGGGLQNTLAIGARFSFIGGGWSNTVATNTTYGFIGGGSQNSVGGQGAAPIAAVVVGGTRNVTLANYSLIFGGDRNVINAGAVGSFIGSGQLNTVASNAQNAAVLSGYSNVAGANYALVMGGYFNEARGVASSVLGGERNLASASNSLAAGTRAKATNQGAFVWADASTNVDFASTRSNQFLVRAAGGVGINTNDPGTNALSVRGRTQITGDLEVTGNILGNVVVTNAVFPTVTANAIVSTNNNPITLQPGGNTGLVVGPQLSTNFVLTNTVNPDRTQGVWSYSSRAHNVMAGSSSNRIAPGVVGGTISGGGYLVTSNAEGIYTNFNEVTGDFGTVSGGSGNVAGQWMATVGGGWANEARGYFSTIGGGLENSIIDPAAAGLSAFILGIGTIAGGELNKIDNTIGGSIGGGYANTIVNTAVFSNQSDYIPWGSVIAGGYYNVISNSDAFTISGGSDNLADNAYHGVIAGGAYNVASSTNEFGVQYPTIGGGYSNVVSGTFATIPGGWNNEAGGFGSFAAGVNAQANHDGVFIWADQQFVPAEITNEQGDPETIMVPDPFASTDLNQYLIRAAGGVGINTNNPNGRALFVAGDLEVTGQILGNVVVTNATFDSLTVNGPILSGSNNTLSGVSAALGGGETNAALAQWSTVGGGFSNRVNGLSGTVAGGEQNLAFAEYSTVAGGAANQANGKDSTVAGGFFNKADADQSFVGGGEQNRASGVGASVVGGFFNEASAPASSVVGGSNNLIMDTADNGAIGGGEFNTVTGTNATVPGGSDNQASGAGSFAAGVNAKALDDNSFVWGGSPAVETVSSGAGSFVVRATNVTRFLTTDATGEPGSPYVGATLAPNATSWSVLSDSNAKTAVTPIDHRETLRKVAAMPVTAWNYKHDPNRRYIGPMAQDFHAAFGLGSDDKHISTLDTDGVTLSAIKGLAEELREQDSALAERQTRIDALEEAVQALREEVRGHLPPAE